MDDTVRSRFIVAQQLMDEGRLEEARLLLLSIDHIPEAADWAARIERGEAVDPDEIIWELDTEAPGLPAVNLPPFRPARAAMAIFLALMLMAPIVQMLMISGPVYPSADVANRHEARVRVQYLCNVLVERAIAEKRLENEFGSCLDFSLSLTDAQMRAVTRCHINAGDDFPAFQICVANEGLFPADVITPGQNV
ncbi:MAG: hypothetical protein AAF787_20175 [Chloroflexota bacterium]